MDLVSEKTFIFKIMSISVRLARLMSQAYGPKKKCIIIHLVHSNILINGTLLVHITFSIYI